MKFPFRIFYRVYGYGLLLAWYYGKGDLGEKAFYILLGLTSLLVLSLVKADLLSRMFESSFQSTTTTGLARLAYFIALVEVLGNIALALVTQTNILPLLLIPALDWLWGVVYLRWLPIGVLLSAIGLDMVLQHEAPISHLTSYLFVVAILGGLGRSLYALELKRKQAQSYYDDLREREQALEKANRLLASYNDTLEEVATLRERTRISREIHDSVGHALSTTLIQLQAIDLRLDREASPSHPHISHLVDYVGKALENTRAVVHAMQAEVETHKHFGQSLEALCDQVTNLTGLRIALSGGNLSTLDALSTQAKQSLYRIVQETLTNSLKHGKASLVQIIFSITDDVWLLTLKDNGHGTHHLESKFGLRGIEERMKEMDGSAYFESKAGEGFLTRLTLPKILHNGDIK